MTRVIAVVAMALSLLAPRAGAASAPPLDASFATYMSQVAAAIASGSPAPQLLYPSTSYVRLKTGRLSAPASDYHYRLLAFYNLDLAAYHARLFRGATTTYRGFLASPTSASYIPAGACENNAGYWHLNGARLLFTRNGVPVSVRINSLITDGPRWWVIHLGPNPRPRNVGTVDGFAVGNGSLLAAAGC